MIDLLSLLMGIVVGIAIGAWIRLFKEIKTRKQLVKEAKEEVRKQTGGKE